MCRASDAKATAPPPNACAGHLPRSPAAQREQVDGGRALEGGHAHVVGVNANAGEWAADFNALHREAVQRHQLQPLAARLGHKQPIVEDGQAGRLLEPAERIESE
eukprot:CAMPEP_0181208494 /NCGR_PEP_ID=MMETSP1096-20121128/22151_1 /TAXON_ID=156174 ORGANISM="Chrysochromulina ericina, Strain CCMP281" /NCGR_SAMPLE_ID=MMETSP1096 /ASSEMBLY_ACC=CAM_ASM_000453 /LENGTH=104 /DNA_ID=CAMNT_0023299569 /DNA_START=551 /DNA_END=865 /DNA_ORIENTATION=-